MQRLIKEFDFEVLEFFEENLVFKKEDNVMDLIMSFYLNLISKDINSNEFKDIRNKVSDIIDQRTQSGDHFVFNIHNYVVRKKK